MTTSQQASGGREAWPRDPSYPFRVTVWDRIGDGEWTCQLIYECSTEQDAHEDAQDVIRAYGGDGIEMHYYVGEVA